MAVSAFHWTLLEKAVAHITPGEFEGYFELKRLLASSDQRDREAFRNRFANYYRLNSGGLTDLFKQNYFEHLFACSPVGQDDPYTAILLDLYRFERRTGDRSIQASFVSKLVSIHDESRPIFDRHVSNFFGIGVPSTGTPEFRVAGFVANLRLIEDHYEAWAADDRFLALRRAVHKKQPKLTACHPSRVCDLLVWTVGDRELS